jgi:hypothetical protein
VISEIDFESTITLPAGINLPKPDCAIKLESPVTNGGFNVMAFYLDPDPTMLERLDSELGSAGYNPVGESWYLADAEGTTFTLSPGSTSLILPVLSTPGDVVVVGVKPGEPSEQEAPPQPSGSPTCDEARPIFGHFDANADAAWASFADRYFDGSESAADAWAYEECALSYE